MLSVAAALEKAACCAAARMPASVALAVVGAVVAVCFGLRIRSGPFVGTVEEASCALPGFAHTGTPEPAIGSASAVGDSVGWTFDVQARSQAALAAASCIGSARRSRVPVAPGEKRPSAEPTG